MKKKFSNTLVIGLTMLALTLVLVKATHEDPPFQGNNTDITVQIIRC